MLKVTSRGTGTIIDICRHWFGHTVLLWIRLLEAYAYYKVTKYDFRFSKILIYQLNFPSTIYWVKAIDGYSVDG